MGSSYCTGSSTTPIEGGAVNLEGSTAMPFQMKGNLKPCTGGSLTGSDIPCGLRIPGFEDIKEDAA